MLDMDGESEHRDWTVCEMIQAYELYRAERGILTTEALAPAPLRSVDAKRPEIFVFILDTPSIASCPVFTVNSSIHLRVPRARFLSTWLWLARTDSHSKHSRVNTSSISNKLKPVKSFAQFDLPSLHLSLYVALLKSMTIAWGSVICLGCRSRLPD